MLALSLLDIPPPLIPLTCKVMNCNFLAIGLLPRVHILLGAKRPVDLIYSLAIKLQTCTAKGIKKWEEQVMTVDTRPGK